MGFHSGLPLQFTTEELQAFLEAYRGQVASVHEDTEVSVFDVEQSAPWGLDRIDQPALPLRGQYDYYNLGTGVNVYIVDTVRSDCMTCRAHRRCLLYLCHLPLHAEQWHWQRLREVMQRCYTPETHVGGRCPGKICWLHACGAFVWLAESPVHRGTAGHHRGGFCCRGSAPAIRSSCMGMG